MSKSGNVRKPTLIVITGPTASGKSALAVEVALRLNAEIISADSRQIYQGIPVATAVPSEEERKGVSHHLLEVLPLDAYYSASEFEANSLGILKNLYADNDVAVVCGGSMMYIDALCNGIDELPTVPDCIRGRLMEYWREKGDGWLLKELDRLDPVYYEKVDRRNMKRVFHAVEISIAAARPYSSLLTGRKCDREFDIVKVCLDGPREELFRRINTRVERMMDNGLELEARRVWPSRHLNSLNTVGLKEMFSWFGGEMSREEAISRIQKNTRVYAKKQLTWYKRDNSIKRLDFTIPARKNAEVILEIVAHGK